MASVLIGVALLFATAAAFRSCLPRDNQVARFVGTGWEPYVAIVFTAGAIVGVGFVLQGVMAVLGLA